MERPRALRAGRELTPMNSFFKTNISSRGRVVRGVGALGLFIAGALTFSSVRWLAGLLFASGIFVAFEAARGWCALRACGWKTRL